MTDRINEHIKIYIEARKKILALRYALWLMEYDYKTSMPKANHAYYKIQVRQLTKNIEELMITSSFTESIEFLFLNKALLDADLQTEINLSYHSIHQTTKISADLVKEYNEVLATANEFKDKAIEKDDFSIFLPVLEKIVAYHRNLIKVNETDIIKGYDVILNTYLDKVYVKRYDEIFDELDKNLLEYTHEVITKTPNIRKRLREIPCKIEKQKKLNEHWLKVFRVDLEKCRWKQSEYLFSSGFSSTDVRFTTTFSDYNFLKNYQTFIREIGSTLYEQQNDPRFDNTFLHGKASLSLSESQKRLYSNFIGRDYKFWYANYDKVVSIFDKELRYISVDFFYDYINSIEFTTMIEEADELTYWLHVRVRYEMEKALFNEGYPVKKLPELWKKLTRKYLGVTSKTLEASFLQDATWANGEFGYFPTSLLGSLYAAQFLNQMRKDLDYKKNIKENNIEPMNAWLKENVHCYGKSKLPLEILLLATKEKLNIDYYIKYLRKKYSYYIENF